MRRTMAGTQSAPCIFTISVVTFDSSQSSVGMAGLGMMVHVRAFSLACALPELFGLLRLIGTSVFYL